MQDYKPSIDMKISEPDAAGYVVVKFSGELDKAGLEVVKEDLNKLTESVNEKYLVLDFSDLNFINSEGIGFLMTMHYRLSKKEKDLVVVGAAEHVYDVLKVIGLLSVMKHFGSLEEFKESIS